MKHLSIAAAIAAAVFFGCEDPEPTKANLEATYQAFIEFYESEEALELARGLGNVDTARMFENRLEDIAAENGVSRDKFEPLEERLEKDPQIRKLRKELEAARRELIKRVVSR
jgi:hypothetical protein